MRHKFLLCTFFISSSFFSFAQKGTRTFAITGQSKGNFAWTDIREIDLASGKITNVLFDNEKFQSGESKADLISAKNSPVDKNIAGAGIAACAYDKKSNRLYFTPLFSGELDYLDLNTKTPTFVLNQLSLVAKPEGGQLTEESHITRMTMGADGNGYAITNDGNHLIQFTTGKKVVATDLGNLVDDQSNNGISIHNKCSSWGGDMVADAYGKLYIFTATHNVFTVDVKSRIATYAGVVKNLSGSFTVNGAAVDDNDNIIIGSANTFEGFYKVNMKDLSATKLNTTGQVFNVADLANSNLLYESEARNSLGTAELPKEVVGNDMVSVYPNPISGTQFKVSFDKKASGKYNVQLTDVQGRLIVKKDVYIKYPNQVEVMEMQTKPAGGMYLIKVTDENKKSVLSDKIVVD